MLQDLLNLLPNAATQLPVGALTGVAGGAAVLALVGARLSRAFLSLALVALGAVIGLHMPKWFGWSIDPMGTAFGAAILLGLSGFVLSRLWEALLLGGVFAAWAGAITWLTLVPGAVWQCPRLDWQMTAGEMGLAVWTSIPTAANKELAGALAIGLLLGGLLAPLWPRAGRILLYAVGGCTIFVLAGGLAARQARPAWFQKVPPEMATQVGIFAGAIAVSAFVQWLVLPRLSKSRRNPIDEPQDHRDHRRNKPTPQDVAASVHRPDKSRAETIPLEDWPPRHVSADENASQGASAEAPSVVAPPPAHPAPIPFDLSDEPPAPAPGVAPALDWPGNVRESLAKNPPATNQVPPITRPK